MAAYAAAGIRNLLSPRTSRPYARPPVCHPRTGPRWNDRERLQARGSGRVFREGLLLPPGTGNANSPESLEKQGSAIGARGP